MDELIGRLVADTGIDRAAAEKAVAIILDFLMKEAPAEKVRPFLAKLPEQKPWWRRSRPKAAAKTISWAAAP
jgi:hypothetical protein